MSPTGPAALRGATKGNKPARAALEAELGVNGDATQAATERRTAKGKKASDSAAKRGTQPAAKGEHSFTEQYALALAATAPAHTCAPQHLALKTTALAHALHTAPARPALGRAEMAAAKPSASSPGHPSGPELSGEAVRLPLTESSARPASTFSPTEFRPEPNDVGAATTPAPTAPPSWLPTDALHDEQLRLAVSPSSMRWSTEAGSVQLSIRGNEVTVRAQGAVGAELSRTESELRLALAQGGLTLTEVKAPSATADATNDSSGSSPRDDDQPQHHRHAREENDEWT